MRWLTLLFISLLLLIVYLANHAALPGVLAYVYVIPYGDKVGHFVLMGTLSFLVNLTWGGAQMAWGDWRVLKGSVVVAAVVLLEELTQIWNPYRTFSLVDFAADLLGIWLLGQAAVRWLALQNSRKV